MTNSCFVLTGVTVLLAMAGHTSARADSARLLVRGVSAAVGDGAAGGFAYLQSMTALAVETNTRRRVYTVSTGCRPVALTTDAVALSCAGVPAPMILRLATGRVSPLAVPANAEVVVLALGTQWLLGDDDFSPDGVHQEDTTIALNWRTGSIVDLGPDDSFGRHAYPNLDAPGLRAALCSPTIRLASGNGHGPFDVTPYARVTKSGPWILETTQRSYVVKRCGRHGDVVHLTISPAASGAVLGTDALAYLDHKFIKLEALTGRTSISIPWPTSTRPTIAFAGRQLLISALDPSGSYSIYDAPRRKGPGGTAAPSRDTASHVS